MEWLTVVYLIYTFIAFYFLFIYILTYVQNRREIYQIVKPDKIRALSIIVPCFNEADTIGRNIESLLSSDYKGLKKIIVVDDCSTDNSFEVIKKYAKKYSRVIAVQTPKNTGCAAGAKNFGAKFADTELIGFSDADSYPKKDAISNMVGYFNDSKTGAVTSRVLVFNQKNKMTKFQGIEYKIIAFTRKLLGFLEAIYVTNGPLSIYRKKAYDEVRGFDESNLTEDIEITWHFVSKGWKVYMSIPSRVYTTVPETVKMWFKQRVRWNVGGLQTIIKYKSKFLETGMLGLFILPFFVTSWTLGIIGLLFLAYRIFNYVIVRYLVTTLSVSSEVALVSLNNLNLSPSILFFFGIALFSLSFMYTLLALSYSREKEFKHPIHDILLYSVFYLLMYPPLLIYAIYKYFKGGYAWR